LHHKQHIQTFLDLSNVRRKSNIARVETQYYTPNCIYVWKYEFQHTGTYRPQHGGPPNVIAQEVSSAALVSICSHSHKEKFGARFKNVTPIFLLFSTTAQA
jgi:hypothetical protein